MKRCWAVLLLLLLCASTAQAEGFYLMDWSARGMGLAGGMVGRANDASAIAYNAAGITQLPGTTFLVGGATVTPQCSVEGTFRDGSTHTTSLTNSTWLMGHGYASHQLNDNVWLGFGMFSRFGTGVTFASNWFGRYSMYDVGMQTLSMVPTVAYKFNDNFSMSLGVDIMYTSLYLGQRAALLSPYGNLGDADMRIDASGVGVGAHVGLHYKFNEQWAVGLAYKSQIKMHVTGNSDLTPWDTAQTGHPAFNPVFGQYHKQMDAGVSGTVMLPDNLALGVTWKPLPNLSFEVGTIYTRWSSYNALNMYFDSGAESINDKDFRDGWNFNVSVEYSPLDWLTLRAGYIYETPVVNKNYADFIVPNNGRDVLSLGMGFKYENWTLDIAWQHLWNHPLTYGSSRTAGIASAGITGARIQNPQSDAFGLSVGYTF